jgi:hypothetical protein
MQPCSDRTQRSRSILAPFCLNGATRGALFHGDYEAVYERTGLLKWRKAEPCARTTGAHVRADFEERFAADGCRVGVNGLGRGKSERRMLAVAGGAPRPRTTNACSARLRRRAGLSRSEASGRPTWRRRRRRSRTNTTLGAAHSGRGSRSGAPATAGKTDRMLPTSTPQRAAAHLRSPRNPSAATSGRHGMRRGSRRLQQLRFAQGLFHQCLACSAQRRDRRTHRRPAQTQPRHRPLGRRGTRLAKQLPVHGE